MLTLDYVDVKAGKESRESIYFYDANRLVWQQNGMDRNPWDSAVQFQDNLISHRFPADSGFTVSYHFVIDGAVPADLAIVVERPDLYAITCNGKPVQAKGGDWWLDKAFGRIALADVATEGTNTVTLTAHPFTMFHEVESAYVIGDFSLEPREHGFVIVPPRPLEITPAKPVQVHGINPDGTMWLSGGIGYAHNADGTPVEDRNPFLVFDLGKPVDLSGLRIWNYCEGHVSDLTSRGVKELRVRVIPEGKRSTDSVDKGVFTLARAQGPARPETLELKAPATRFVILEMVSNQNGVHYPVKGDAPDNGFVGLAEVQFVNASGEVATGVSLDRMSGELASHQRTANHLLDGSGLTTERPGWKEQGLPFYAGTVAYQQDFKVEDATGPFFVRLPAWLGSVARVKVNGRLAGRIISPPWQCDVTDQIVAGQNTVVVEVVGTLKNTLGPHHGNPGLGSAWPGMFQHGPNPGPPPGNEYSQVSYGLFEPFVLEQH
ncbi:MAG: hypothetical protein KDM81_05480 [Verrucomicrobiae bacterium]|nr:hypothetical protein [Verrucomicrobiae bacterium]